MSIIEVKGLCKSFGSLNVLQNVDLNVEQGEKVAIIGGSGCGKSVLLRSLELLTKPDKGQIFIDGEEITKRGTDVDRIRRKLGMVYQGFNLFTHMDVMDNLCLAPTHLLKIPRVTAEAKALEQLRTVSLEDRAYSMPSELSGGQKQRIAIARCLMMEPKVLLFDEPTSALDPTMVGEVLATIRQLAKRGMTMLIVTHEMAFARELADRVLFLAEKGIYEQGTPHEIFDAPSGKLTQAFIRKLKTYQYHISSRRFDLMQLEGGVAGFCEKYGISGKMAWRLQLVTEEMVMALLNGCYPNQDAASIDMELTYSEQNGGTELRFYSGGAVYNPIKDDGLSESAVLGVTILKSIAKSIDYRCEDGINRFIIQM